ncbi:ribonuclease H-like domain-containing protein [Tanacetum coccineum]
MNKPYLVIVNGDSVSPVASASIGVEGPIPPKATEQKLARKNELKAKSTLMLAIPDEHLLKFHACKDAKSLWEAIKNSQEGLDKTYDRFQKLISQLEIHGKVISQEDANLKLLRSLPSAWNNIALIMRNKPDLDTLSMDDLYNNLKVYKSEIKGKSSSISNSQNVAFVSLDNSSGTNETVNNAHSVSAASSKDQASTASYVDDVMFSFFSNQSNALRLDFEDLEQVDADDLEKMDLKWQVAMLTMRVKRFIKKTGRKIDLNDKETVGFNRTKVECYNCYRRCHFAREYRAPRNQGNRNKDAPRRNAPANTSTTNALVVQDGIGLESLEARIVVHEKNKAVYEEDIAFLKYGVQVKDISIKDLTNHQISDKDKAGLGYDSQMNKSEVVHRVFKSRESDVDDSQVNDRFKTGEGFHAVPPPYTGNYMPSRPDLSFVGLDDSVYKTKVSETETSISKNIVEKPKTVRPSAPIIEEWDTDSDNDSVFRHKSDQTKPKFTKRNFVKSGENVKSVNKKNTHRQVEYPRKSQSPRDNKRNWNGMMTQKLGNGFEFIKKACFICGSFNYLIKDCDFHKNKMVEKPELNNKGMVTGQREIRPVWNNAQRVNHQNKLTHPHPKRNFVPTAVATKSGQVPVNAAKQSSPRAATSISTARPVNTVAHKPKGNPQYTLQEQGIFDSGCSRHMTGNKSFLIDYQEIDGGFVVFGGSPKGGKITGKGKIRTGKLDFEDVYFVKELKFNLFPVSQMCDKKNSVLFTETECLVLSPNFKLLDESQVLLKVPRQNNMYSFDLKNVVPSGGLTCLFSKATIDDSSLWHRRLGHIIFKTMNKLVWGNLKGKQQKASCKTKLVSSISQPLQMLHMDLFGATSIRSINHKIYCLVVTDDYSRYYNGTEFKNNDMNQFCRMKRIKREFSVARTPQQNRVAERKNMTLIEVARTMLADSLLPTTFWAKVVSIACYVQNRVLVTKPHNKTAYELLHGRPPSISFMRPFRCPVTILNTLDPLGNFDKKADEGFFVGYSINNKAFRVFNTRTRKVEENLHITFLENKPNVAGSGPDWLFDIDLLTNSMNYEPVTAGNQTNRNAGIKDNIDAVSTQQYILLPLLYDSLQRSEDVVAADAGKKTNEKQANKGERNGQEKEGGASNKEGDQNVQDFRAELDNLLVQQKEGYVNNTNRVSTISPSVSAAGQSFDTANDLPTDPLMPDLEDTANLLNTGIFSGAYDDDDEDEGAEADLNNLEKP